LSPTLLAELDRALAASLCFGGNTGSGWTFDVSITLPLLFFGLVYVTGVGRLWRRAGWGRGASSVQVACFAGGWLALGGALVSPLHALSERLFSAHMIEHEVLMAVAAPLLVISRPGGTLLWGLPKAWRRAIGRGLRGGWVRRTWHAIREPFTATVLHGLAIWVWHAPGLFEAALAHLWVHWLQHFSFLGSALLFWWALTQGRARADRYGAAVIHLFATSMHTALLGALLLISHRLWFPLQGTDALLWGLTPLEDQQMAGLIMWIPAGTVYAGAALVMAGLWVTSRSRQIRHEEGTHAISQG
jgi:putative membrane protein